LGRRILDRVAEEVADLGKVEVTPRQDGRNMTMVLGPDRKAQAAAQKRAAAADAEALATEEPTDDDVDAAPTEPVDEMAADE
jgi:translation initiation factor IF-3